MSDELRKSGILLKNALGVLDLSQMEELEKLDKAMTPEDVENRANDAELFWRTHFEKVLLVMILAQMKLIAIGRVTTKGDKITVENEQKLLFSRGFLLGLVTLGEWFEEQRAIALKRFETEEESPPDEVIKPVGGIDT